MPSDRSYSDVAVGIGEALGDLHHSDAWPDTVERRFAIASEAVADLSRELKELEALNDRQRTDQ